MKQYLQLLTEADEQIEKDQKAQLRVKFAEVVNGMKNDIDRDFITKVSNEMTIPHEEVEKLIVDFAINYSTMVASTKAAGISEDELSKGIAIEKDLHGINDEVAKKLAADNILKDPEYYRSESEESSEEDTTEEIAAEEPANEEAPPAEDLAAPAEAEAAPAETEDTEESK